MQGVVFLLVAVALYFLADWILQRIELRAGRRLEHRTLVFFFLLLVLALASFTAIQRVLPP